MQKYSIVGTVKYYCKYKRKVWIYCTWHSRVFSMKTKQNKTEQNRKIWTQINTPDVFQRCLLNSFLLAGQIDDLRWTLEKLMAFCVPDFFLLPSKTYNCTFVQRLSEAEYHHGYADTLITQKCLHFPSEAVYSCVWSWDECGHTQWTHTHSSSHLSWSFQLKWPALLFPL